MFSAVPLARIYSASSLRCRETVEGLAATRGLAVGTDPVFDRSGAAEEILDLIGADTRGPVLFCAERSLIEDLLVMLGVGEQDPAPPRCRKASVWRVERRRGRVVRADYLPPPREQTPTGGPSSRWAVLDLGSTSFSLVVVDMDAREGWRRVLRERVMLGLGAHVSSGRRIPVEDLERAGLAARRLRAEADSVGCRNLLPVGTAIFRDAENGSELIARVEEALGQPLRLLSGSEEAELAYSAIRSRLEIGKERLFALDLGGGSLEFAIGAGSGAERTVSLPLGVTRLHAEFVSGDRLSEDEEQAIRLRVREVVADCLESFGGPHQGHHLAGAGGTLRSLARLMSGRGKASSHLGLNRSILARNELEGIVDRMRSGASWVGPGIPRRRVALLPVGAIVLSTLLSTLEREALTVCDWGLREGVLLEALSRKGGAGT